ncbi:hypothetical protein [Anaerosinus massiliensis]|uniref:hypothetical protein n=1 Tax=Massilibacillus massiliensis TaxID=1806837 RepID=UPI000DA636B0|nr:hypothetical protein [Massilibacillus massiliensis]
MSGGNAQAGANAAYNGVKYNDYVHKPTAEGSIIYDPDKGFYKIRYDENGEEDDEYMGSDWYPDPNQRYWRQDKDDNYGTMGWEYEAGNEKYGGPYKDHEVDVKSYYGVNIVDDHGYKASVDLKGKLDEYGRVAQDFLPFYGTGAGLTSKGVKTVEEVSAWSKLTGIDLQLFAEGGEAAISAAGSINPSDIRFTQSSISAIFKDGRTVSELINGLKTGEISSTSIAPIRVFERDGKFFTLDNRRLYAYQQAGIAVPFRWAAAEEVANESWEFTTKNGGVGIRVRGGED